MTGRQPGRARQRPGAVIVPGHLRHGITRDVTRIVAQAREAGCRIHLKPNLLGRTGSQLSGMQLPDEYPAYADAGPAGAVETRTEAGT
jgi:hypothetical protein